MIINWLW